MKPTNSAIEPGVICGAVCFVLAILLLGSVAYGNTNLLTDTFDVSQQSYDMNFQLSTRQSGALATNGYSWYGYPIHPTVQLDYAGFDNVLMIKANDSSPNPWVAPNMNFIGYDKLHISYDVHPVVQGGGWGDMPADWGGIILGDAQGPAWLSSKLVFLVRGNGDTAMFDNLSYAVLPTLTSNITHHIEMDLDKRGTHYYWSITGDGVPLLTDHQAQCSIAQNYVTLIVYGQGATYVGHTYDNLCFTVPPRGSVVVFR